MPRQIQLPTSQTPCTPVGGVATSYSLATLLAAALAAAGLSLPGGGSYCAASFIFSNSGEGDAYLCKLADLPAQVQTITVTQAADGVWTVALTAPDGTAISAEYTASGSATANTIGAGLRAALTTLCAGHGLTVGGSNAVATLTAAVGSKWTMGAVTPPGIGTATSVETSAETEARTNQVIAGETTKANPYQFGSLMIGSTTVATTYLAGTDTVLPWLRCLPDSSVTVTIILEVP